MASDGRIVNLIGALADFDIADANVRVSAEELARTGRESVQLTDGSGDYMGVLGKFSVVPIFFHSSMLTFCKDVFHELHCVVSHMPPETGTFTDRMPLRNTSISTSTRSTIT